MREIALHLLDIVQNSVTAGASLVEIGFHLAEDGMLSMSVRDDGCGMSPELLARVRNPFVTTRTTRKVGLGIPLLQQNAMASGGDVTLESELGRGTTITARFNTASIDCLPLGDLAETLATIIMGSPDKPDFSLTCSSPAGEMDFSTREVRAVLGEEVSLAEPEVVQWIRDSLREEIEPILGGIMR
ncbi:MAG: sensor histidine kinase [Clostridia bacterium]|nr:sensor histidine kinase [Clostridia bacterium]